MGSASEQCKQSLSKGKIYPSSSLSFRLRCPTLNSLHLRRSFDVFDRNHDSMITVDELDQALSILGLNTDRSELESMVKLYIKPGNDGLRFEDFEALHRSLDDAFFGSTLEDEFAADDRSCKSSAVEDEADLTEAFKGIR